MRDESRRREATPRRAGTGACPYPIHRCFEALALLLEVDIRLRWNGFASVHDALRLPHGAAGTAAPPDRRLEEARRMARSIRRAARLVPHARCLHRSLALLLWLRRRGVPAE